MDKICRVTNEVREFRLFAGKMTQAELAKQVGVSARTFISLEKGGYDPSLSLAFRIAKVFDVPIEEVFSCQWE